MVKNKLWIAREWHIQPSEIDRMQYFEYEYILEEIQDYNKKEEKRQKEEEKKYAGIGKMPNVNQMMSNASNSFKMPNLGSMPKI